jgi:AraC-like DNA-binding protein
MDPSVIEALLMPATYGRHLARMFPLDALLAGTGLGAADFEERERRITVRQALQYISNTLKLADEPDWYMAWAGTLAEHFHGPVSFALMSSPTLGDGLDAFLRHFPARIPYMHMQGRRDGEYFYAELCPLIELGAARALLVETPLIVLQQYLDTLYGVDFAAMRVELDYAAPLYADRYARYFKGPVTFGCARNALVMPLEWRELRNLDYHESTWAHAQRQCEALVSSSDRTTLGEVRSLLCSAFEISDRRRALPTLEEVAAALHLAPRTLIRRLRRFGTSYQAMMDQFLRARAAELLASDTIKIKEVAAALGFQNPANFGKAFKRWYGVSPGSYRIQRIQSSQ